MLELLTRHFGAKNVGILSHIDKNYKLIKYFNVKKHIKLLGEYLSKYFLLILFVQSKLIKTWLTKIDTQMNWSTNLTITNFMLQKLTKKLPPTRIN